MAQSLPSLVANGFIMCICLFSSLLLIRASAWNSKHNCLRLQNHHSWWTTRLSGTPKRAPFFDLPDSSRLALPSITVLNASLSRLLRHFPGTILGSLLIGRLFSRSGQCNPYQKPRFAIIFEGGGASLELSVSCCGVTAHLGFARTFLLISAPSTPAVQRGIGSYDIISFLLDRKRIAESVLRGQCRNYG